MGRGKRCVANLKPKNGGSVGRETGNGKPIRKKSIESKTSGARKARTHKKAGGQGVEWCLRPGRRLTSTEERATRGREGGREGGRKGGREGTSRGHDQAHLSKFALR